MSGAFRFDEFTFDGQSQQLLCNGQERHLSPKARHLLHLLLAARPRALSREELYDALWPATFVSETNLAGVVNEVRHALGDGGRSSPYIRTVHGFGYAFRGDVIAVPPAPVLSAHLFCEGQRYPLFDGENTLGRAEDCGVVLADPTVSRHHALIEIRDGKIVVKDLQSKNGTFLNGERIRFSPLAKGDKIVFGAVHATVVPRKFSSTASLRRPHLPG